MGGSQSHPSLTQDMLEDYVMLTYLSKGEILHLMKKFSSINPEKVQNDYHYRISKEEILNKFPAIKNNPFSDRIFTVFSSKDDDCFSFEDMIDLCSAMSDRCPINVKAAWAFKIYDLDGDNQISQDDISGIIDRLTLLRKNSGTCVDQESKTKIADIILKEFNLDRSGSIGLTEFQLIMSRLTEFPSSFYFRL